VQSSKRVKAKTGAPASELSSHHSLKKEVNDKRRKSQRRQRASANPTTSVTVREPVFSCVICTNDVLRASLPSSITATCKHPPQTCRPCLSSWISSRLQTSGQSSLTCPQCTEQLTNIEIKAFTTPEIYEQYEVLVLRSSLSNNPEFHWCIAPGCQSGQLHADSNPIFRCAQCSFRSCIKHKVQWHDGLTCTEYDASVVSRQREMEEAASRKMIKETSRQCPGKNCGWRIEKNDGCDHMTCRKCNTEFCWLCKANYKDIWRLGNTAHKPTCRYYTTNLP
jgi:hypothetical protein